MTHMFKTVTRTVNAQVGCRYGCTYCWARRMVKGRLKKHPKYMGRFSPSFHPEVLKQTFHPEEMIFFTDMGDLMGWWVPQKVILEHIAVCCVCSRTTFLFQTKNPHRHLDFSFPLNVLCGTTIETNIEHVMISKAPSVAERAAAMAALHHPRKFLSIEPIMDFDLKEFVSMIEYIGAIEAIEIGADTQKCHLPEPEPAKVRELIIALKNKGYKVIQKDNLARIVEG